VGRDRAGDLGIVRVDPSLRITGLAEKPQSDDQLRPYRLAPGWLEGRGIPPQGREYLANMGIYLFRRSALFQLLDSLPSATDLVREVFARSLATHRIQAYLFDGYWEDLGTVRAYHEANLALAGESPPFDFHSPEGVIFTRMRHLPASRVGDAVLDQCLISDGCLIESGVKLERCVVGLRSRIGRHAALRDTILIGADRYETESERNGNRGRGQSDFGVGEDSVIERAILDKDCRVGRNVRIINQRRVHEYDGPDYFVRDGIVVVPNGAVIPDGAVI
jgi:glucose-1-phosphate adenylyltransferase